MKKLIYLFIALLCISQHVTAQVPSYVPTDGLVGYWPFNGNANDESGNGNNGTVNGATLTNDRDGNENSSYSFDGLNDYISLFEGGQINFKDDDSFSYGLWFIQGASETNSYGNSNGSILTSKNNSWNGTILTVNYASNEVVFQLEGDEDGVNSMVVSPSNLGDDDNSSSSNFEGNWSGQYTGDDDNGNWTANINSDGILNGTATSTVFNESYDINGTTSENGNLTAALGTASSGGEFIGQFNGNRGNGTWTNTRVNYNGNWTGNLNSWVYLSFVYDSSSRVLKAFYNGSKVDEISVVETLRGDLTYSSMWIGRRTNYTPLNTYVVGSIDDIGIWNRALTEQEIANLYASNSLSTNPVTYNSTVNIYPNPANDQITIDCGNLDNVEGWNIKITNMLGQEVFSQPMNTQQYVIPLHTWTGQGMYFVKIINAQNEVINIKKIVLQ